MALSKYICENNKIGEKLFNTLTSVGKVLMLDSEYNKKIGNKNNVIEFLKNTSSEDLNYYLSKNSMQMLQQKKIDEWLQRLHSCLSSILNIISQF